MGCTAIKITKEDGSIARIKFLTVGYPDHTDVDVYQCDENFQPMGNPLATTSDLDEESYHRSLRDDAHKKGQYVSEESTDPQLNPGYVEIEEAEDDDNGDQDSL